MGKGLNIIRFNKTNQSYEGYSLMRKFGEIRVRKEREERVVEESRVGDCRKGLRVSRESVGRGGRGVVKIQTEKRYGEG